MKLNAKVLRIILKIFQYQVESTWNRIEMILQVLPTPIRYLSQLSSILTLLHTIACYTKLAALCLYIVDIVDFDCGSELLISFDYYLHCNGKPVTINY